MIIKNRAVTQEILSITKEYQNGISREEIIECFSNSRNTLVRGFLMTIIWGHGYSDHGRADNRGPWKVSGMLSDFENATKMLETAKKHLLNSDLVGAHQVFDKMKKCRVSFFSKYLYFLGRALDLDQYPLIFDTRVAVSILELGAIDSNLSLVLQVQPKQNAESYDLYVTEIHKIAKRFDIEADKIEYFLFLGI